jgi:pimeloyl-ACP methyl ester carboxylesterase
MQPERLTFTIPANQALKLPVHQLVCWQWGSPKAAKTVLCVHGLTRNGRDFDFLAAALANDFRVLCPDMSGRGESQWLPNAASYHYPTYGADILWMLAILGVAKVHWVGTSMGGIIALVMGAALQGRLASLTLNDVGCIIPAAGLKRILSYVGTQTSFATRAEAEATLRKNCASFGMKSDAAWQNMFAHSIQQTPEGTFRLAYDPAISRAFPKPDDIQDVDLWPFWPAMAGVPILVVRGAESDILLRETALEMKEKHPALILHEVEGAGHAPALTEKEDIDFIHQWLTSLRA